MDIKCIKNSLAGYMRAYETRREMHLQELYKQGQAAYELEMRYAKGEDFPQLALKPDAGRNRWWKKTVGRFIKAVVRVFSV
ncbi:uncharacterized protein ColSpa_08893 [Colletotrichum spaethianum]|uniref:Uncharacterized protein n=1 Tax=Colletotrichum spaethianum TaxID=700344 RepID=A0AA37PAL8_9PEZI|nr:uncharacterized protein ColSpa_08893 [Colletotrichum spaethianum]GKT48712.1 hypothetical protein ColSpa_08893 [Colletotrichum spaethianum]